MIAKFYAVRRGRVHMNRKEPTKAAKTVQRWSRSPRKCQKLNVREAWDKGSLVAGLGCVLQNEEGYFLGGYCGATTTTPVIEGG